jgi:hypothetical protein
MDEMKNTITQELQAQKELTSSLGEKIEQTNTNFKKFIEQNRIETIETINLSAKIFMEIASKSQNQICLNTFAEVSNLIKENEENIKRLEFVIESHNNTINNEIIIPLNDSIHLVTQDNLESNNNIEKELDNLKNIIIIQNIRIRKLNDTMLELKEGMKMINDKLDKRPSIKPGQRDNGNPEQNQRNDGGNGGGDGMMKIQKNTRKAKTKILQNHLISQLKKMITKAKTQKKSQNV